MHVDGEHGEDQAGHVKLIGAALYQRLLARAVAVVRGEIDADEPSTPDVLLGEAGAIPIDYVPDAVIRIGLYGRLARLDAVDEIDSFEEELEDRFGAIPQAVADLLSLARLRALARAGRVRQVKAGPKGVALTVSAKRADAAAKRLARLKLETSVKDDRVIVAAPTETEAERSARRDGSITAITAS